MLIVLILAGLTLVSFILSMIAIVFKIMALAFLTILLGMLTVWSFKKYRENKISNYHSTIDELLQNNDYQVEHAQKESFTQKSEEFSNGLFPFALAFFTFCSFCVLIFMLIK